MVKGGWSSAVNTSLVEHKVDFFSTEVGGTVTIGSTSDPLDSRPFISLETMKELSTNQMTRAVLLD